MIDKLDEIVEKFKLTPQQITALVDQIKHPEESHKHVKHHWGKRHITIGLLSDTHIGSKHADYDALHDLMARFSAAKVSAVYVAGDITEGYNRRKGHSFECDMHGADEQVDGVVKRFPRIGKPIYFITGDHDGWHWENAGVDVGKAISEKRDDMHYIGARSATVQLAPKTTMMLMHPAKGTAYALSYQIQKLCESFSGGQKPNILAVGHYHKAEYLFYRNIHCLQTGCIENQTPWMKTMNLSAHKGGWLLRMTLRNDGSIDTFSPTLIPYYE